MVVAPAMKTSTTLSRLSQPGTSAGSHSPGTGRPLLTERRAMLAVVTWSAPRQTILMAPGRAALHQGIYECTLPNHGLLYP